MSALTVLAKIRADHQPHAGNPAHLCDACRLLEYVDREREAINRCLEWISKSQVDPIAMSRTLQEGLGR